jgi:acid phosphatase type 7
MRASRAARPTAIAAVLAGAVVPAASACGDAEPAPGAAPAAPTRLTTAYLRPVRARRAVVWAVGDGASASSEAKALARRIAAGRPDRFLYLGDVYASGTADEFRRNYRSVYGALDRVTAPTPGNHDWPRHRQGYDPYWSRVRGKRTPAYYAFRVAGWQLLSLNSEIRHDRGSRQLRWLRATLARGRGTCRLAFWHRPRFSAGEHGDQHDVAPLWNALRNRAAIVLGGHDHDMQRFAPIAGITQFVSGAGGKSLYRVDRDDRRLAFADDRVYGALRLVLTPRAARYAFVAASGRVLDTGVLRCRRGARA